MNKDVLTNIIAKETGCSKSAAIRAWDQIVFNIKTDLEATRHSSVPNVGNLHVRPRAARPERPGHNPKTGAALVIPAQPAKKTVVLSVAKALKDSLNP